MSFHETVSNANHFTATITADTTISTRNVWSTVIFNSLVTGSNFDTTTGIFTAPVNGVYFFTVDLLTRSTNTLTNNVNFGFIYGATSVINYTLMIFSRFTTTDARFSGRHSITVFLNAGETARVVVNLFQQNVVIEYFNFNAKSFFSGYLVAAVPSLT